MLWAKWKYGAVVLTSDHVHMKWHHFFYMQTPWTRRHLKAKKSVTLNVKQSQKIEMERYQLSLHSIDFSFVAT